MTFRRIRKTGGYGPQKSLVCVLSVFLFQTKPAVMKTILRHFFACVVIALSLNYVRAQEVPETVTERFFELFHAQGVDDAVDYVFATNKWLTSEKAVIENIKLQLKKGISILGQYYGYELIEKKSLGESYVLLSYMLKYDRQPIQFMFILYRPNNAWQIQNLKFDERLDDDIEDMR
jgi:hypothetical protein